MSDFPREKCLILFQFPCLHLLWSEIFILQVIEILYYFLTKKKKDVRFEDVPWKNV